MKNHYFTPKNHSFYNYGGRREKCWGISCEKSRFYAKNNNFFSNFRGGGRAPGAPPPPLDPPLITSVFLPSPSYLLTLPNYLLRILFSSVIIILLITSSSLLLSSSFTFVTSSFPSSSLKSPLQYLFRYFLIIILLTISILFHIDSLPNSSPSSSLFYSSSISPSSPSSFYHSPSVLSILLFIFLPSCPLPHTCQLCLSALSKLDFFSLALRKIALSLKCFSHPFLLPPYPFSLHVHACLSYYYYHC